MAARQWQLENKAIHTNNFILVQEIQRDRIQYAIFLYSISRNVYVCISSATLLIITLFSWLASWLLVIDGPLDHLPKQCSEAAHARQPPLLCRSAIRADPKILSQYANYLPPHYLSASGPSIFPLPFPIQEEASTVEGWGLAEVGASCQSAAWYNCFSWPEVVSQLCQ